MGQPRRTACPLKLMIRVYATTVQRGQQGTERYHGYAFHHFAHSPSFFRHFSSSGTTISLAVINEALSFFVTRRPIRLKDIEISGGVEELGVVASPPMWQGRPRPCCKAEAALLHPKDLSSQSLLSPSIIAINISASPSTGGSWLRSTALTRTSAGDAATGTSGGGAGWR